MNYWFWLYIILVPLIVFAVKPEVPRWQRVGRLLLAIVLCYGLMLLSDRLHYELWAERLNNNPNTTHKEFMALAGASGAASFILLFLGWLWSTVYVGFWELIWQIRYRKRTKHHKAEDYALSYIIIIISMIIIIIAICMIAALIYHEISR